MKPSITLHNDEKMLFSCRPSKRLIFYIAILRGRFFIVLPIFLSILYYLMQHTTSKTLLSLFEILAIGVISINILGYMWLTYVLNRHWYFFTNLRCIIYSGYWGINKKIIPYNRIVDINMNRNPLRVIFGLAALYIVQQGVASQYSQGMGSNTSGISPNMAIIDGLTPDMAERIMNLVSQQMSKA